MTQKKKAILFLACLASTFACGELGDAGERSALAVIDGRLDQQGATPSSLEEASNVRVAVLWMTSNVGYKSAYDVPVVPVFPSKFRVELLDPPPEAAMVNFGDDVVAPTGDNENVSRPKTLPLPAHAYAVGPQSASFAVGTIVAYEDRNGNGQLDLLDPDAPPVDRVLGANEELLLVYVEGGLPPAGFFSAISEPTKGYNLLRQPPCEASLPTSGSATPAACEPGVWLPITTLYDLPLTAEPQFASLMCGSTGTATDHYATVSNVQPGETPPPAPGPDGWPSADEAGVVCGAGGTTYTWGRCESASTGLCRATQVRCSEHTYSLPEGTPPPEWPCELN
jgi:hypothetical protein